MDEATTDFIRTCIAASFPDGGARLIDATEIPLGFNALWRLRVEHDGDSLDLVLRRYTHWLTWHASDDREKAPREAAALEHARVHRVPVPALYGHGPDWTLVSHVDGQRLFPRHDAGIADPRGLRALANTLARMHQAPQPNGPFPRVTVTRSLATMREWARSEDNARMAAAVDRIGELHEEDPVWVHGDPNLSNVLFDAEFAVAGLIDWEDSALADYRFDVAATYWFLRFRVSAGEAAAFIAAYESASGRPVRDLPQWFAFLSVRGWAVDAPLRHIAPATNLFGPDYMDEAERRVAAAGW